MRAFLLAAVLVACSNDSAASGPATTPSPAQTAVAKDPAPTPAAPTQVAEGDKDKPAKPAPPKEKPVDKPADKRVEKPVDKPKAAETASDGHDFTGEARALYAIGACGGLPPPESFPAKVLERHCDGDNGVKKAQADYTTAWVKPAREFFAAHVPSDIPKKVVYPFAGGDLSTALTVFPDADEITTISLEPAGDPRDIGTLSGTALQSALDKVRDELKFLYRVNFSNTMNMIDAMRSGQLPTQLIFGLSALKIHGYEVVSLRYFKLEDDGSIHYFDDTDLAKAPSAKKAKADFRNRVFANAELQFKKPGGRTQIYRHLQWNLDDDHLKKDKRILKHLEAKAPFAGMTKAASYLLSWDSFSTMRNFLIKNTTWMVSDATGIAPKWGKPAGFEYETYGQFTGPHMNAGLTISPDWKAEFAAQPKRELPFRFGYYDKKNANHLIMIRKKSS